MVQNLIAHFYFFVFTLRYVVIAIAIAMPDFNAIANGKLQYV